MLTRFLAGVGLCLALVLSSHDGTARAEPVAFAPPPAMDAREPRSQQEREAGVVVLSHSMHIEAFARGGEEYTEEFHQLRYLVLDQAGARDVAQHVFFSAEDDSYQVLSLEGQTIAADGTVIALDPAIDMQLLDARDGDGASTVSLRSINFPRVSAGAILDLAYRTRVAGVQPIKLVRLERDFPTRELDLQVRVRSDDDRRWVASRVGSLPPSATATITSQMDLQLKAQDLPARRAEPFAPPDVRRGLALALALESVPDGTWQDHLLLWPEQPPQVTGDLATGRLGKSAMALDPYGLQRAPAPSELSGLDQLVRDYLGPDLVDEARYLRRKRRAESRAEVAELAPTNLPWYERAELLFDHARSRLRVDANRSNRTLDRALRGGFAGPGEVTLYYQYLLDQAGIRNHQALLLSRRRLPFSPALGELDLYDPLLVVRAGPASSPRYYPVGDAVAGARAFSDAYLGALAFVRERGSDRWSAERVPGDTPVHELTVIELTSALPLEGEPTDLQMRMFLEDAAARPPRAGLRLRGGGVHAGREAAEAFSRDMLSAWVGINDDRPVEPTSNPRVSPLEPLQFQVQSHWQPTVQDLDGRLLIRPLPDTWRTSNPFTALERNLPMWLAGGDYDLRMRWRLPPGYAYAGGPVTREAEGPAGLYFSFSVTTEQDEAGTLLVSRLALSEPYIVDASDYAQVQDFFETLQREVDRRKLLVVRTR